MAKKLERWAVMNKILLISFGLITLFAWADSKNVLGLRKIETVVTGQTIWNTWFQDMLPAIFVIWIGALGAIALIWYLVKKDKSEALALFLTPVILIIFGVQDIIYYIISPDVMRECVGCWADALTPVRVISDALGETCPTMKSFTLSAAIGGVLAYFVYTKLQKAKW